MILTSIGLRFVFIALADLKILHRPPAVGGKMKHFAFPVENLRELVPRAFLPWPFTAVHRVAAKADRPPSVR